MAQILFTWELGGGIGHLTRLRPLAQRLSEQGHRLAFSLRDHSRAGLVFDCVEAEFFQAPVSPGQSPIRIEPPRTLAHVLYNTGFSSAQQLGGMVGSWQAIVDSVDPDLVVFDHSPAALAATRGYAVRRIVVGNGFACPAAVDPMPDWRPWMNQDPDRLRSDEHRVRDVVNEVLRAKDQPALSRLSELYTDVDDTLLTTVEELDAVPNRDTTDYFGDWSVSFGKTPVWPEADGLRVFAYLKPFPTLPFLLADLVRSRLPTIIFAASLPADVIQRFQASTILYEQQPMNMNAVASQCDVAILNATHSSVFQLLRGGAPLLNVPLNLEQRLTADNVSRMNAGVWVDPRTCKDFESPLQQLLTDPQFAEAAASFATRYAELEPQRQLTRALSRIEDVLASRR